MCGIVGADQRPIANFLIEGLKRLEYKVMILLASRLSTLTTAP